jgi:hypothetical protein
VLDSGYRQRDVEEVVAEVNRRPLDKAMGMVHGHTLDKVTETVHGRRRGIGMVPAIRLVNEIDMEPEAREKRHASATGSAPAALAKRLSNADDIARAVPEKASASTLRRWQGAQATQRGSRQGVPKAVEARLREDATALSTVRGMQSPGSRSTTSSWMNRAYASEGSHSSSATRLPAVFPVLRRPGSGRLQLHKR